MVEDNTKVYDERVAPLMASIYATCMEHEIPFIAEIQYAPDRIHTTICVCDDADDMAPHMAKLHDFVLREAAERELIDVEVDTENPKK